MRAILIASFTLLSVIFISSCKQETVATCGVPSGTVTLNATTTSATFKWNTVSGATSYKIQYHFTNSTGWLTASTTADSLNVTGLTPSSLYEWEVETICNNGVPVYSYPTGFATATPGTWTFNSATYTALVTQVSGNVLSATGSNPNGTLSVYFPGSSLPTTAGNYTIARYNGTPAANTVSLVMTIGGNTYNSTGTGSAIVNVSGGKVGVSMANVEMQNTTLASDSGQIGIGVLTQP